MTASDTGSTGFLVLSSTSTAFSNTTAAGLGLTAGAVTGTSTNRTDLQSNYNTLLTQINQLASDSGYNGINLLAGNNLTCLLYTSPSSS